MSLVFSRLVFTDDVLRERGGIFLTVSSACFSKKSAVSLYVVFCVSVYVTTVLLPAVVLQSSHAELLLMESKKTSLLGRAESLKRSATELPADFHRKIHNLTHTWRQLEVTHTHTRRDTQATQGCSLRNAKHRDGIWRITLIFLLR